MKLIGDLYSDNIENKSFVNSRYSITENNLEPYKSIISDALYVDIYKDKSTKLSREKKAITDYFNPKKDEQEQLEFLDSTNKGQACINWKLIH